MALEQGSWLLPLAKEAYERREDIAGAWEKLSAWLLGEKKTIAFTGCAGVGKTVLVDYLTQDAYQQSYHPPDQSQKEEKGNLSAPRKRIRLVTIPGQSSGPRFEAFKKLISDDDTVDGIVHVVANGFASTRDNTAKQILIHDQNLQTIEEYRRAQRIIEVDDLRRTCDFIRQSHQRHHRPNWLIVAVGKLDLYYNQLDAARLEYSPFGKSEFATILNELRDDVGKNFFRWDAAPVCGWLEHFEWNLETTECRLLPDQRDHYVATFAKKLTTFC
jgi:GTPase SAR1 family protein